MVNGCGGEQDAVALYQFIVHLPVLNGFSSWSLFSKSVYLVTQVPDCNDCKSTIVLHTVLIMNMFSPLVSHAMHAVDQRMHVSHVHERSEQQNFHGRRSHGKCAGVD